MRLNYEIAVVGKRCILVPYRKVHVPTYHEWMQDPQLLESTGSEPLTLPSEYEMQTSWLDDNCKCTFIVLDRERVDELLLIESSAMVVATTTTTTDAAVVADDLCDDPPPPAPTALPPVVVKTEFILETLSAMVGDVNLFLSNLDDDDLEDDNCGKDGKTTRGVIGDLATRRGDTESEPCRRQAEIDIMVAVATSRGKGIGQEAVALMLQYARENIPGLRRFFCKINADNVASRMLFEKKLGFQQCGYAECFQQYEYELRFSHPCKFNADETSTPLQVLHCPVFNEEE